MATNPLISQGTLNRIRGSLIIPDAPALNITAPFLGKNGITVAFDGDTTEYFPTMTGAVTSQEPYQMVTINVQLLKTQSLSDQYKRRMENNSLLGNITVRPDAKTLSPFQIINCSIAGVGELAFNGLDAFFGARLRGYWPINASLWN